HQRHSADIVRSIHLHFTLPQAAPEKNALMRGGTIRFAGMDWASFLAHHNLVYSLSRRGNCQSDDVVEAPSICRSERIRRKVYRSRDDASQNAVRVHPKRQHVIMGMLAQVHHACVAGYGITARPAKAPAACYSYI